jgi:hypothetical protein
VAAVTDEVAAIGVAVARIRLLVVAMAVRMLGFGRSGVIVVALCLPCLQIQLVSRRVVIGSDDAGKHERQRCHDGNDLSRPRLADAAHAVPHICGPPMDLHFANFKA